MVCCIVSFLVFFRILFANIIYVFHAFMTWRPRHHRASCINFIMPTLILFCSRLCFITFITRDIAYIEVSTKRAQLACDNNTITRIKSLLSWGLFYCAGFLRFSVMYYNEITREWNGGWVVSLESLYRWEI